MSIIEIESAAEPARHPLLQSLVDDQGLPSVTRDTLTAFLDSPQGASSKAVLYFTGDVERHRESLDVAVVLPQLLRAYPHFKAGIVEKEQTRLAADLEVVVYPTLVFFRDGQKLGSITRMRDWQEFVTRIDALFETEETRHSA